ncbi:MAG: zinc-binding dehydrogenase, partial [Anaerolineae bacterium]|nr:zinc-binding dehydrogenase [Anaerolineae bacterium]
RCTHIGLCGSNRGPFLAEGVWDQGKWPLKLGWTGHENVGIVAQSRNPDWREGMRVLGQAKGYDGFTEYIACQPSTLHRLPDNGDIASYVVAQPVATVLCALARTRPVIGESCAVLGQGPIGLIFTYLLRQMGAVRVIAADSVPWRLEWAERLGATDVVDTSQTDVVQAVNDLTGNQRVDFCIEAVGHEETYIQAAYLPRHRGRLCVFGVPHFEMQSFPWLHTTGNETEIVISRGKGWTDYADAAIALLDGPYAALKSIATPTLPWEQAEQAFRMYVYPADYRDSLKILLEL